METIGTKIATNNKTIAVKRPNLTIVVCGVRMPKYAFDEFDKDIRRSFFGGWSKR